MKYLPNTHIFEGLQWSFQRLNHSTKGENMFVFESIYISKWNFELFQHYFI